MRSPVLFIVFNRPETTGQVFEAVRAAQPPRLYVAADGPRANIEDERTRCAETRRIATAVDWPCQVRTLFQDTNLGCRVGPVTALDWFFDCEEEGIVLEDDVLPLPTFFAFCDELLERYRDDARVGVISGSNLISSRFNCPDSYFFSRYQHVWGWATWRRTWQLYDVDVRAWPAWRDDGGLRSMSDGNRRFESFWGWAYDAAYRGGVNWWSYQLQFACWYKQMLTAIPARSQTWNLGFGPDSTHTRGRAPSYLRKSPPQSLDFALRHPGLVASDPAVDRLIGKDVHGLAVRGVLARRANLTKRFVRRVPVLGDSLKWLQARLLRGIRILIGRR